MIFNDAELAALESGIQRIGVFFRLDVEPDPVRLWLGIGRIEPGVNVYDPTGASYLGFGELRNVPAFNQLVNGKAARIEFSISGVSGDVLGIASGGDAEQVKGKPVAVGFAVMGEDWGLLGDLHWCAALTADRLSISQNADDAWGDVTRSVTLSCGTLMTSRRRPSLSYLTNQDQTARFTGDRFCERTPRYATGFNKTWPTFPP